MHAWVCMEVPQGEQKTHQKSFKNMNKYIVHFKMCLICSKALMVHLWLKNNILLSLVDVDAVKCIVLY